MSSRSKNPSLVLVAPYADSVMRFRGSLISELVARGCKVVVLAPDFTPKIRDVVKLLGAIPEDYRLARTGVNPLHDLLTLWDLVRFFRSFRPEIVLAYQPKPNIYGTLAAWLAGVPGRYALVEGLGFAFTQGEENLKRIMLRTVLRVLYKISLSRAVKVFFLNQDDFGDFQRMGLVRPRKGILLGGIGVDLEEWPPASPHLTPPTFTLIARLLREKGVLEFVEAARLIKARHSEVRFLLIGPLDTNPGAIQEADVRRWVEEGLVEWVPWADDVRPYLRRTSVYVLPSYREGVPRSTQEALAMARPIITTDAPGCKETVVQGKNGFLVPIRDAKALAEAMEEFIREPGLIERMGRESRRIAEDRFDARKFNAKLMEHIGIK